MPLPALSLWPGRQPYRPRLVGGRRGCGPDSATSSPLLTDGGTSVMLSFQVCSLLLLAEESSGIVGVWRMSCAFHAAGNRPPEVRRGDTGQVRWFEAARADSAAVV